MYNKWTSLSNCNERIRSRERFRVMMDGSRTWRGGHHNDMNTHKWIVLNVDPAAVRAIAETGLRGTWPLPHFPSACISPRNLLQYILYRSDHIWGPSACSRCDAMWCHSQFTGQFSIYSVVEHQIVVRKDTNDDILWRFVLLFYSMGFSSFLFAFYSIHSRWGCPRPTFHLKANGPAKAKHLPECWLKDAWQTNYRMQP